MTIDSAKHKSLLLRILKDIFTDTEISPYLGFKGGTAAMFFYNLDRLSVDIDLDLLDEKKEDIIFEKLEKIATQYGKVIEARKKRFNILFVISYDLKSQNIKIEINRRNFNCKYEIKTLLGISMPVMTKSDMLANKLVAMYERVGKTSRDIYDVYYFLKNNWPINKNLIEQRTKLSFEKFLKESIFIMEKFKNTHILDGLGETLSESQKDWARAKLRDETIFLLKVLLESEK